MSFSIELENRISILSLDTFLLWIFIELNSLSTFENAGGECAKDRGFLGSIFMNEKKLSQKI
jgi:hypothetical protein